MLLMKDIIDDSNELIRTVSKEVELPLSKENHDLLMKMHEFLVVEGFDVLTNKDVKIVARGFLAICLQHELDHFDGVLYYDHINKEYPLVPIENAMVIE